MHHQEKIIEGVNCYNSVSDLPEEVDSISIITPPVVTEKIVKQAIDKGIKNIWMQPGAESSKAITMGNNEKINVISGGPCVLVTMGFKDY